MASQPLAVRTVQIDLRESGTNRLRDPRDVIGELASNELVFAVVGHVGAGTTYIAEALVHALGQGDLSAGRPYTSKLLKARQVIETWALLRKKPIPASDKRIDSTILLQNYGDEMRRQKTTLGEDHSAVARGMILNIAKARAEMMGKQSEFAAGEQVVPDGARRAYVLDSIRHPAEVELLRQVYQEAFVLIGVVCPEEKRLQRIEKKYRNAGEEDAKAFMERDADGRQKSGQRVTDAFHLADFFIDNGEDRSSRADQANRTWKVLEKLHRLVKLITHAEVLRPSIEETAMHHAYSAKMQSACLSRQVGAALVDEAGNIIATGTNEVPKGGGGVYGEPDLRSFPSQPTGVLHVIADSRCAHRKESFCSNTREHVEIIRSLISTVPELNQLPQARQSEIFETIKRGKVGGLLEFSRAVHAEMDALLSAGRTGASTVGTRLFVTTFPCHYCARHIVTAGVAEVQFIEPYPMSLAMKLHNDSICIGSDGDIPSATVLFRPFEGVSPRMYKRAFLKDRELKDPVSGNRSIMQPEWGTGWRLNTVSYVEIEKKLGEIDEQLAQAEARLDSNP